jgi:hypothetical protein
MTTSRDPRVSGWEWVCIGTRYRNFQCIRPSLMRPVNGVNGVNGVNAVPAPIE